MVQKYNEGLTSKEAAKKLSEFGPNLIFKPAKTSLFGIVKREIEEPMILLLLVVGFLYGIWGELEDTVTIFIVIFLLVSVEAFNEFRAKKAVDSLERIAAPKTKVIRNGGVSEIYSEEVVPGDILILIPGVKVAADAKIRQSEDLQIDESPLTGESYPSDKNYGEDIFAGTVIVSGEGRAEVFCTGENTKLGKIASMMKQIEPQKTALQIAMKSLAGKLVYIAVFLSSLVAILGILNGNDIETMILTGLSLSFVTIPEELPIVITMVLGLGAYSLSKKNFFIKKINAAETLGNSTVIVTDKTGTITESKMKIVSIYPEGGDKEKTVIQNAINAFSQYSLSGMEREIKSKALKLGVSAMPHEMVRLRNLGNGRKSRSVIRKNGNEYELFASGAPEEIFTMCRGIKSDIKNELNEQASKGRRVIAIAYKKIVYGEEGLNFNELEKELDFEGLISFEDPPRNGVKETIAKAAEAGIRTIMVTGDHVLTAGFIAKEVGILTESGRVLTGENIDGLTDEELQDTVKTVSVFARNTPQHKYRIVQALRKNGEIVAVTGDGINDVLALKSANISIAMGIRGTDAAKEAADIVLADDNYITIAHGIFEGRKFFDNLQKGIKYYLSVKVSLILIFLIPVFLYIPVPLMPIQIIILELFMDVAASTGFVAEPAEKNIYSRLPRNPQESIISAKAVKDILIKGSVLFIAVSSVYFYTRLKNFDIVQSRTLAFASLIIGYIALVFISRSDDESIFSIGLFSNKIINFWSLAAVGFLFLEIYIPFLRERFGLFPVSLLQLLLTMLATTFIMGLLEIRKIFVRDVYSRA